ncbi:DUF6379 domain-containing protein [Streptomyces sp. NPDC048179]|uniref:C-glycoside deglycosidase beta subunit domain-containing protein n=1 Tax=Streptomyces sp. NPDC048179 TaxID=3365506 RepID=UPI003711C0EE
MNENHLIETQGFRPVTRDGRVVGFAFEARIGYYRGVPLTIVSNLAVSVDGEPCRREDIRFTVDGREYTLDEMAREERVRWEYGARATISVLSGRALGPGAHVVRLSETVFPSYMPPPGFVSHGERVMTIVDPVQEPSAQSLGVSLYSYQYEYFLGRMSLADALAEVAAIGATGVQLLPEQMMPGYPEPSTAWVDEWHRLIELHGLTPTVMDTFIDGAQAGHRALSHEEAVDRLVAQMKLAKLLGFPAIRPTTGPVEDAAPELVRAALPDAERLDIRILPEIHAPVRLDGPLTTSYVELIEKTGTRHLGFTLDLGVFCRRMPAALLAQARRRGVSEEILDYITGAFAVSRPTGEVVAHVRDMGGTEAALTLAGHSGAFGPRTNTAANLTALMPYVGNVHAKFYEIEDGEEKTIPYADVMSAIAASGYTGSLDSEYEGQRLVQDAFEVDSCEQVRRHHALMRKLLLA